MKLQDLRRHGRLTLSHSETWCPEDDLRHVEARRLPSNEHPPGDSILRPEHTVDDRPERLRVHEVRGHELVDARRLAFDPHVAELDLLAVGELRQLLDEVRVKALLESIEHPA